MEKTFVTNDQDRLQVVIVHPEADNKEQVKAEHKGYFYKRELLRA